jgi:DNA-binding HxlR family transcriptional regulator
MSERRCYDQFCGVARALDVLGERWTLLLVRDLLLSPRRYGELLAINDGLTTNLLARRLKDLTAAGVISCRGGLYALTAAGMDLEPVVMELGRWGRQWADGPRQPEERRDIGWAMLSMQRRFLPGWKGVVEVRVGSDPTRTFTWTFGRDRLMVRERAADLPDVAVAGAVEDVLAWLFGGASSASLRAGGRLRVEGEPSAWEGLLGAVAGLVG